MESETLAHSYKRTVDESIQVCQDVKEQFRLQEILKAKAEQQLPGASPEDITRAFNNLAFYETTSPNKLRLPRALKALDEQELSTILTRHGKKPSVSPREAIRELPPCKSMITDHHKAPYRLIGQHYANIIARHLDTDQKPACTFPGTGVLAMHGLPPVIANALAEDNLVSLCPGRTR